MRSTSRFILTYSFRFSTSSFTAPLERRMAVGNVVRSDEPAPSLIPKFLQNIFNKDEDSSSIKRANPTVMNMDDECYMGKDGDADDCVDFDPPHN
jgi:hypothetical protein